MYLISEDYLAHARSRGSHKYIRREGSSGRYKYIYAEDLRKNPDVMEVSPGDFRYTKGHVLPGTGRAARIGYVSNFQVGQYERKHRAGQGAHRGTAGGMKKQKKTRTVQKGMQFLNRLHRGGLLSVLIGSIGK